MRAPICCSTGLDIPKRWSHARRRRGILLSAGAHAHSARISLPAWDPLIGWATCELGANFILAEGIIHTPQPDTAIEAVRNALPSDPWAVAALHVITTLTGSALLAVALRQGVLNAEEAWHAAHVDEDWNSERWGVDDEVMTRRA